MVRYGADARENGGFPDVFLCTFWKVCGYWSMLYLESTAVYLLYLLKPFNKQTKSVIFLPFFAFLEGLTLDNDLGGIKGFQEMIYCKPLIVEYLSGYIKKNGEYITGVNPSRPAALTISRHRERKI